MLSLGIRCSKYMKRLDEYRRKNVAIIDLRRLILNSKLISCLFGLHTDSMKRDGTEEPVDLYHSVSQLAQKLNFEG